MAFELKGTRGSLRVGGRPAVTFGAFTFAVRDESVGGGWRVEAEVRERDGYWLERAKAYDLRLDLTRSSWRFREVPAEAVVVDAATVTITHRGEPEDA
jgi:hypothetical protein